MTKTDAITMMKNSAMWKDITQDFKYWCKYKRCLAEGDSGDKLHLMTDDAVMKTDINFIEIIVKSYGVFEIMKEIADDYGDDEVICIIKDKEGDMRYKCLLFHILMNMLKEEFEEELDDIRM